MSYVEQLEARASKFGMSLTRGPKYTWFLYNSNDLLCSSEDGVDLKTVEQVVSTLENDQAASDQTSWPQRSSAEAM